MKKIIIASCILAIGLPAANAQTKALSRTKRSTTTTSTSSTTQQRPAPATGNATITNTNTTTTGQQRATGTTTDKPQNTNQTGGMLMPDHSYQPAGTEGVGVYGNGTGGSTIGSTPASGGTGVGATTGQQQHSTRPKTNNTIAR